MTEMFQFATAFDQDLTGWCVEQLPPNQLFCLQHVLANEQTALVGGVL